MAVEKLTSQSHLMHGTWPKFDIDEQTQATSKLIVMAILLNCRDCQIAATVKVSVLLSFCDANLLVQLICNF